MHPKRVALAMVLKLVPDRDREILAMPHESERDDDIRASRQPRRIGRASGPAIIHHANRDTADAADLSRRRKRPPELTQAPRVPA